MFGRNPPRLREPISAENRGAGSRLASFNIEVIMALVTNITKTLEVPGETETVVIRKLSHTQLKAAARARQSEGVGFMREMGGELLKALRESDTATVKRIQETQEADINNYDRDTLLKLGVVSWSYPLPPVVEGGPNGLDQQDEPTAKWLAEQIFAYSRPETKVEAKNA